jgi:hypothetical protein
MGAAPRERGNLSCLRKTPLKQMSVRWVSRSRWCGAHLASRKRGAIPSTHGLETTLVDVRRYLECAERRASAPAPPPRFLARRPLFWLVADEKCVPAHIKRQKNAPRTVNSLSAVRRERTPPASAPPTKISRIPDPWSIDILPKFGRWHRYVSRHVLWLASFLSTVTVRV